MKGRRRFGTTYHANWNANEAFWAEMARNPGFRAYMTGIATLSTMHSACPTAECSGLYQALAEAGAERLIQIAEQIEAQRQRQLRIQEEKDKAVASFVPA